MENKQISHKCTFPSNLPCFIKRKVRNDENNGIDQQRDRRGPAERCILATMMQGVLQPSSIFPEYKYLSRYKYVTKIHIFLNNHDCCTRYYLFFL